MRDAGIGTVANEFIDEGWRRVDEGIERAREVVDEGLDKARRAKETIENAVERALDRAREHGLIKYEDLPDPWKINPHILQGYRFHEGKLDCIRSTLSLHNELFNIWSHAIGFFLVLTIAFYFYPTSVNFTHSTNADVFIAAVFFFAACKCLVCSTIWHTMNSISHQTLLERFACVDYTGISLLVATSIMTTEYTAFYCEPTSRWIYILTTAALGIGGVILPWHPTFNRQDLAWVRVLFYVSLAATGFLPVFQLAMTRGLYWAVYFYSPITKSILVYLGGAVLYASKIPERWFPGMFDYVGGSHNLWHLAVLGGILFHYLAMQELFAQAFLRARMHCSVY
jgi:adiponectin receptor